MASPPTCSDTPTPSNESQRLLVAACTYNEIENLPTLIAKIQAAVPGADVLVIDDNSPDGSGRWATDAADASESITAIVRDGKQGLGSAIVLAMQHAIDLQYDGLINLDADLSHDPGDIPRLLAEARRTSADIVIGSRYVRGGSIRGWPLRRRVLSALLNRVATTFLRLPVQDCSGAFRYYRVAKLSTLDLTEIRSTGYAMLEEVLWLLSRSNAKIQEVPICFTNREEGKSKLNFSESVRSGWAILTMRRKRKQA